MNSTHFARLKRARINLLMDEPFFGTLMMQLRPIEDPSVKRFCTNGDFLKYNPDYMDTLDDGQLRTVLAHEVLHPALLHPFRVGPRDLKVANEAADYAINNFLDDYNKQAAKGGNPEPFPWPKKVGVQPSGCPGEPDVLIDHQYDDKCFEEIYADLMRNQSSSSSSSNSPPHRG